MSLPIFISVTPFGPYCSLCKVPLSVERGMLRHAKEFHSEILFKNGTAVRAVKKMITELRQTYSSDFSTFLNSDSKSKELWYCFACYVSFQKTSNYRRHLDAHTTSCNADTCEKVHCFPTICGRLGPKKSILHPLDSSNRRITSKNLSSSNDMSSTIVPTSLMITQQAAVDILRKYVRSDEDPADLSLIFYPLLGPSFECDMMQLIKCATDKSNTSPILEKWISVGNLWLSHYAAGHIANVSANVRNRIAEFEQRELDGVTLGTRTFVLRRGVDRLAAELETFLRFLFRFPTTLFDEFKTENILRESEHSLIRSAIIPKILLIAMKEEPSDHNQLPIACRYSLSRGFSLKGTILVMNECGWFASRISALMHLMRAGVCGYLVTLTVSSDSHALTIKELDFVQSIQHGRVTNMLAPYIKRLRDMNNRKPPIKNNTVNSDGDVTSGAFTFPKSVWSTIIPRLTRLAKIIFENVFQDRSWMFFFSEPISVVDWIRLDAYVIKNHRRYTLQSLALHDDIQASIDKLQEIMELAFFGLGVGAVRHEEICRIKLNMCQWHNSYIYYWSRSLKKASLKGSSVQSKMVEHRLSLTLSKVVLLSRHVMNQSDQLENGDILQHQSHASMLELVKDIFDFDYSPQMLNVRHLFTSIGNILLPAGTNEITVQSLVSTPVLTFKSGHTQETGKRAYSTWIENSDEMLYDFYHKSLGESCLKPPPMHFVPFPSSILLSALQQLIGRNLSWRTVQQEEMVEFSANSHMRHSFINIPCGHGKSMSWLVPIVASLLSGRQVGIRIVIVPYKFLLGHMVFQAKRLLGLLIEKINVEVAYSTEIDENSIPNFLEGHDIPSLLFLNLDAASKLLRYHMDALKKLANQNILKRIFVDEFQQLISEFSFRVSYLSMRELGQIGAPVMCLSGSLSTSLSISLMTFCRLMNCGQPESSDQVTQIDPIGDGFTFSIEVVENISSSVTDFVVKQRVGSCHILCETKLILRRIQEILPPHLRVLVVSGESNSDEQAQCAREWAAGGHDILISTVVALVGNENMNCRTVVIAGFLYNVSSLVQAIGRLRPEQRGPSSVVKIFRLPFRSENSTQARMEEEQSFRELTASGCLDESMKDDFSALFSPVGLKKFMKHKGGCYLQFLSELYGFSRNSCERCGLCTLVCPKPDDTANQPSQTNGLSNRSALGKKRSFEGTATQTQSIESRSKNLVAVTKKIDDKNIRLKANSVLHELLYRCIACGKVICNGECIRGCYRCGDKNHLTNGCTYNTTRLSNILANKGVCYGCFDTTHRGMKFHDIKQCPLQRRLKRLLFLDREKRSMNFEQYLRYIYSDEMTFLKMISGFAGHVTLGRVWMNEIRSKKYLNSTQLKDDSSQCPLLPPSEIVNSPDASVDGMLRTVTFKNAHQAKQEYHRLQKLPSSAHRQRKFVFGALYNRLFNGFFEVDPRSGDLDLIVTLSSGDITTVHVSMIDPDQGVGRDKLLPSIVALGSALKGQGNVRGGKVGDTGSMHGFGYRSGKNKEEFKGSLELRQKVEVCSSLMRHYMEDNLRDILKTIIDRDKSLGVHGLIPYMQNGPGSRMMFSINLANAAHYDVGDTSLSVAVWAEQRPGQASNWYFVLPNVTYNGSMGVAIMLHHGVVISWDGQKVYHCTSKTSVGINNQVYGCLWSSSRN